MSLPVAEEAFAGLTVFLTGGFFTVLSPLLGLLFLASGATFSSLPMPNANAEAEARTVRALAAAFMAVSCTDKLEILEEEGVETVAPELIFRRFVALLSVPG